MSGLFFMTEVRSSVKSQVAITVSLLCRTANEMANRAEIGLLLAVLVSVSVKTATETANGQVGILCCRIDRSLY